jgi:hypothetical protein
MSKVLNNNCVRRQETIPVEHYFTNPRPSKNDLEKNIMGCSFVYWMEHGWIIAYKDAIMVDN